MQQNGAQPGVPGFQSVPVWIDEFREVQGKPIVRVAYLAVEATQPTEGGSLPLAGLSVPFIATGLTAALCQPSESEMRFESPESISNLLDHVESSDELSVETPDLWLPLFTVTAGSHKPKRGDVYRISRAMLATAIRFRGGQTTIREFIESCEAMPESAVYSEVETKAVEAWAVGEIHGAYDEYTGREHKGKVLKWDDRRQIRDYVPRRPGENKR